MENKRRPPVSAKKRLQILQRDNFTCRSCGKSPSLYPELEIDAVKLEADHIKPFSKGGSGDLNNYQTLCLLCNRGKGNVEQLNITVKNKIDMLLNQINPEIVRVLLVSNRVVVVSNDTDFQELIRLNSLCNSYSIQALPNTINGYQAGHSLGIYTVRDNYAGKVNFIIINSEPGPE
ncbi:MAG: HNH endonuclease [Patescibacteria group bacterium]|jgi:hypothetical protein